MSLVLRNEELAGAEAAHLETAFLRANPPIRVPHAGRVGPKP